MNLKSEGEKNKKRFLKITLKNACYFFRGYDIIIGKLKERTAMTLGICKISDTLLKPFYSLNSVHLNRFNF